MLELYDKMTQSFKDELTRQDITVEQFLAQ